MFEGRTLPAFLDELAHKIGDRTAISDRYRSASFTDIREEAIAIAKGLHALGIRPGDKVGILMGNRVEWAAIAFGVQYAGGVLVALNTWYTAQELHYVLEHSDCTILLMADRFLKADYVKDLNSLRPFGASLPLLKTIVVLSDVAHEGMLRFSDFLHDGETIPHDDVAASAAGWRPSDTAFLLYTSGSTARPKGVQLVHGHLIENPFSIGERQHLDPTDVMFLTISLFWGFGCSNALFSAWTHGMHIVLQESFDPVEALMLIEKYRCTTFYGTPNMVHALATHPDRAHRDISSLRKGGASGAPSAMRELISTMMPMVCNIYGLTEGYGHSSMTDADDPIELRSRSIGRALPGGEVAIVDIATDEPVPAGETGEIRIRGYVTPGYYKDPVRTAESFDRHGRFKTGDLGRYDEDGNLYFQGRLKEMIKTGGINVSPAEVEEVLLSHSSVREAFVIGLPDAVREEVLGAAIVLAEGAVADEAGLITYCRERLAVYKVPRRLRFVVPGDLPLTATGKVHKMRIPELFE